MVRVAAVLAEALGAVEASAVVLTAAAHVAAEASAAVIAVEVTVAVVTAVADTAVVTEVAGRIRAPVL